MRQTEIPVFPTGFRCLTCEDVLQVKKPLTELTQDEIDDAVAGFMVEHVQKHGGDPHIVYFQDESSSTFWRALAAQ